MRNWPKRNNPRPARIRHYGSGDRQVWQFNRLRITGFKSFVEPSDLLIEPGLTGIVGPNGCGKSNLVEALRWVMGESSAKMMRGGEMDDVIFSGCAGRAARSMAEVSLELENGVEPINLAFVDSPEVVISRRIERDKGSSYRVNGREVRARDVQLLFADAASGPRSSAMVTQGQVGALINAKPADRRRILEEAAGIAGLHARRQEAESRLKSAEGNLERLDDVLVTLEGQLANLKKQARQATRYRTVAQRLRETEAAILLLKWTQAAERARSAADALAVAERRVTESDAAAVTATAKRDALAIELPHLRQAAMDAAAECRRLAAEREALDAEDRRLAADLAAAESRLQHLETDHRREEDRRRDAAETLGRLAAEERRLIDAQSGEEARQTAADQALADVTAEIAAVERRNTELSDAIAEREASRAALEQEMRSLRGQEGRLAKRAADLASQRERLAKTAADLTALAEAADAVATAEAALADAQAAAEAAEATRAVRAADAETAREARQQAELLVTRLTAEAESLAALTAAQSRDVDQPLIDRLRVEKGCERAVAAALGDAALASVDEAAAVCWRTLPPLGPTPLPAATTPLSGIVSGPPAIARLTAATGIVNSSEDGARLQAALHPGQRLVSRDGALWRWDGLTIAAGETSVAAVALEQRTRLAELQGERQAAAAAFEQARDAADRLRREAEAATVAAREARQAAQAAEKTVGAARRRDAEAGQAWARIETQRAGLDDAETTVAEERAALAARVEALAGQYAATPDASGDRAALDAGRARLGELRAAQLERRSAVESRRREAAGRRRRLENLTSERETWHARQRAATEQMAALDDRLAAERTAIAELRAAPAAIADRRAALLDQEEQADAVRRRTAEALTSAEARGADAEKAARAAEATLAASREDRVRAEANRDHATQAEAAALAQACERLGLDGREVARRASEIDAAATDLAEAERRLERLTRERDMIGPVNLRADAEAEAVTQQIAEMQAQRTDLTEAIGKLRRGISELNRDGRQRLLAAFAEVDRHFQDLFGRLFSGGRGHLALTESDDPLTAGLEIMASPPGKTLQTMSLLSGGEQALTALALRFALFLTQPTPLCVLDEVDAPLDDANVDRFCDLLREMAEAGTRFLVVTHNRTTMVHMNRLFGVTMAEPGVSQLVSVDLQAAEALRQTA